MRTSAVLFVAIFSGVFIVTAILLALRLKSRGRLLNVGSVSHRWVAEHYVGSGNSISRR
jgi:hypothetical protein